ncbi:hypothetical protein KY284_033228 [Solanum tuberosum]|nr:hypothetical protein KY284_033228 [Solanum tuberosum]
MEKNDIFQPISVVLNGSNYRHWCEAMRNFFKGRKLWRYVTCDLTCLKQTETETNEKFVDRLEDWDSRNHPIITWLRNTSVPSIHLRFGQFDTAKEVWDHLSQRYTTYDLSHRFQLMKEITSLKQEKGKLVYEFLSKMESIWNQLTLIEPVLRNFDVAAKFLAYRNNDKLSQFLMALTDDYEPTRAALLNQQLLPTLENALPLLKSEQTCLDLMRPVDNSIFAVINRIGAKFYRNCRQTVMPYTTAQLLNVINVRRRDIYLGIVLQFAVLAVTNNSGTSSIDLQALLSQLISPTGNNLAALVTPLGYGIEHKGYRCWDPMSNRIRISRHVIFWEHIKFSSPSKFESIPSSELTFFSNPSVELFQSDRNAGSSSESDIAPNSSPISLDASPSDGPVHGSSTTSNSHD